MEILLALQKVEYNQTLIPPIRAFSAFYFSIDSCCSIILPQYPKVVENIILKQKTLFFSKIIHLQEIRN